MAKLALVFAVLAVTFRVIQSDVSQQDDSSAQPENDSQNQPEEDLGDTPDDLRQSYAFGGANAAAGGYGSAPSPQIRHECLSCVGCPSPLNSTVKQCGYTLDPSKRRKCVVYGEKYHHSKDDFVVRGCASERGSCADVRASHTNHGDVVKLLFCWECEGDRCNTNGAGIPHSLPDLLMAFVVLVVTPVITKYTMS